MAPKNAFPTMSSNDDIDFEASQLSRRFSEDVVPHLPENALTQAMPAANAVRQAEENEIWERFKEISEDLNTSREVTRELEIATKKMRESHKKLSDAIQTQDEKNAGKKPKFHLPSFSSTDPDDLEDEEETMLKKIGNSAQKLIVTADRYSDLFKFIPSGNEYVSVVAGVVTTIVKATANHKKIGDGFEKAVDHIGVEMRYFADMIVRLRGSNDIDIDKVKIIVANFFLRVFNFLNPYVIWCGSWTKRLGASLDKDYYKSHVEGPLAEIFAESRRLERQGNAQTAEGVIELQARVAILSRQNAYLSQQSKEQKELLIDIRRKLNRREDQNSGQGTAIEQQQKLLLQLGEQGNLLTQLMAEQQLKRNRDVEEEKQKTQKSHHIQNLWTSAVKSVVATKPKTSSNSQKALQWVDVEVASRILEITAENGYPLDPVEIDNNMRTDPVIQQYLQAWMAATESQRLWICGPAYAGAISEVSMAAAYIVLLCERIKVPCVAYRFRVDEFGLSNGEFSKEGAKLGRSLEMDRLAMMLYSVIRQLVWLLPEEIEIKSDLSFERFFHLDGTTESLLDALNLFEELLALMPQLVVFVIDGFELVDNDMSQNGTPVYLDSFLDILREAERNRILKVLITSDGNCFTLTDEDNIGIDEELRISTFEREESAEFWELLEEELVEM